MADYSDAQADFVERLNAVYSGVADASLWTLVYNDLIHSYQYSLKYSVAQLKDESLVSIQPSGSFAAGDKDLSSSAVLTFYMANQSTADDNLDFEATPITFENVSGCTPTVGSPPTGPVAPNNQTSFTISVAPGAAVMGDPFSFDFLVHHDDYDRNPYRCTVTGTWEEIYPDELIYVWPNFDDVVAPLNAGAGGIGTNPVTPVEAVAGKSGYYDLGSNGIFAVTDGVIPPPGSVPPPLTGLTKWMIAQSLGSVVVGDPLDATAVLPFTTLAPGEGFDFSTLDGVTLDFWFYGVAGTVGPDVAYLMLEPTAPVGLIANALFYAQFATPGILDLYLKRPSGAWPVSDIHVNLAYAMGAWNHLRVGIRFGDGVSVLPDLLVSLNGAPPISSAYGGPAEIANLKAVDNFVGMRASDHTLQVANLAIFDEFIPTVTAVPTDPWNWPGINI